MNADDETADAKNETVATTTMAGGEPQAVETTKAQPSKKRGKAKKTESLFNLENEKDEVEKVKEVRRDAIRETLPGYEEMEKEIMADLESLKGRIVARNGSRIDLDDANGKDIYEFDQRHRKGRTGKMPNGQSSFKLISECREIGLTDKQCRRLSDRWALILDFRKLGLTEPRLGVSHYDVVKPLADLEAKLNALRDAEANNLTVAELREKYLQNDSTPMGWKARFDDQVVRTITAFGRIYDLMEKSGGTPDISVMNGIKCVVAAMNRFTPVAKEVAKP